MRILKVLLVAVGGLFAVVLGSNAADTLPLDNHHLLLAHIIFVIVGLLFIAGCVWRMSHADDGNRHEH